jgi:hypothetical protein
LADFLRLPFVIVNIRYLISSFRHICIFISISSTSTSFRRAFIIIINSVLFFLFASQLFFASSTCTLVALGFASTFDLLTPRRHYLQGLLPSRSSIPSSTANMNSSIEHLPHPDDFEVVQLDGANDNTPKRDMMIYEEPKATQYDGSAEKSALDVDLDDLAAGGDRPWANGLCENGCGSCKSYSYHYTPTTLTPASRLRGPLLSLHRTRSHQVPPQAS